MSAPHRLGPFVLDAPLARGGMGAVWAGRHRASGVPVAIKVLLDAADRAPARVAAFEREVALVAALDHPHIVSLLDAGALPEGLPAPLVPGSPYLVMERAGRGSLHEAGFPTTYAELEPLLRALLDALAHAHARGVVHRDLKPGNVLIAGPEDLRLGPKLSDFGIARSFEDVGPGAPISGTPAYMAPEQLAGGVEGPTTDLYALGALAWALATGAPPFVADDLTTLARLHAEAAPPPPRFRFAVPAGFEPWLRALLAKAPAARPPTAAAAARALMALPAPGAPTGGVRAAPVLAEASTVITETLAWGAAPLSRATPSEVCADRPPVPADWRGSAPRAALVARLTRQRLLQGAGLGLFALRRPPFVGREAARDALWAHLQAVATERRPRRVVVEGPPGVGRSRLLAWVGERAAELGVAAVRRGGPPPSPIDDPTLLTLDDAGPASWSACAAAEGPLLVVVAPAPDVDIAGLRPTRVVRLDPLPPVEAGRLARSMLELDRDLVAWLVDWAAGFPARIVEWLGARVAADAFEQTPAGFGLRAAERSAPAAASGLDARLAAALAELDAAEVGRVERALLGAPPLPERPAWAWLRAAGLPIDPLDPALVDAVARHARAAGRLPAHQAALAADCPDPARRARHLLGADRPGEAAEAFGRAADDAMDAGELVRATALLEARDAALAEAGRADEDPDRLQGRIDRGRILVQRARFEDARASLTTVARVARRRGWVGFEAAAWFTLGHAAQQRDRFEEAAARFRRALQALDRAPADPTRRRGAPSRAEIQLSMARPLRDLGRLDEAEAAYAAAAADFEARGDAPGRARAQRGWAAVLSARGERGRAEALCRDALAALRAAGPLPREETNLLADLADYARLRGDLETAETMFAEMLDHFEATDSSDALIVRLNLGAVRMARADYAGARHLLAECRREADLAGRGGMAAGVRVTLLPCLAAAGDWAEYDRTFDEAEALLVRTGMVVEDVAWPAERAARLCRTAGEVLRGRRAAALAGAQWTRLGQPARAAAVATLFEAE